MICLSLFHGRNTPTEELEDWGFYGPIITNVGFAWTYGSLKVFEIQHDGTFGEMLILKQIDGMIALGSKYYADMEVLLPTDDIALDTEREHLTFFQLKELVEATVVPDYKDLKTEALQEVINYSVADERGSLERYIYDDHGGVDAAAMLDEELYAFCVENEISHIWCHLHILSL